MTRTGSTQRDNIKQFLKDGYSLTALEALSLFGAYRLAAHIEVLRKRDGLPIVTTMNKDVTGRTYARYFIPKGAVGGTPRGVHLWDRGTVSLNTEIAYHAQH